MSGLTSGEAAVIWRDRRRHADEAADDCASLLWHVQRGHITAMGAWKQLRPYARAAIVCWQTYYEPMEVIPGHGPANSAEDLRDIVGTHSGRLNLRGLLKRLLTADATQLPATPPAPAAPSAPAEAARRVRQKVEHARRRKARRRSSVLVPLPDPGASDPPAKVWVNFQVLPGRVAWSVRGPGPTKSVAGSVATLRGAAEAATAAAARVGWGDCRAPIMAALRAVAGRHK